MTRLVETLKPPGLLSQPYTKTLPADSYCWLESGSACASWTGMKFNQET